MLSQYANTSTGRCIRARLLMMACGKVGEGGGWQLSEAQGLAAFQRSVTQQLQPDQCRCMYHHGLLGCECGTHSRLLLLLLLEQTSRHLLLPGRMQDLLAVELSLEIPP